MRLRVKYIDFHWDNYQGGSGKSLEFTAYVEVPVHYTVDRILNHVTNEVAELVVKQRPFLQSNQFVVQSVEIL